MQHKKDVFVKYYATDGNKVEKVFKFIKVFYLILD